MSRMPMTDNGHHGIPEATVARLPVYLRALYALADRGIATVSSEELAAAAGVNSAKLRKDLSHLGSYGTRGVGYDVDYLVYQVSRELGLTQDWPVVIVGAGNLGHALANYGGFASRGFRDRGAARLRPAGRRHRDRPARGQARRRDRGRGRPARRVDRRHRHAGRRGPGGLRPPGRGGRHQHPQLRAGRARTCLPGVDVRKVDLSIELQILAFHAQRRAVVRVAHNGEREWQGRRPGGADGELAARQTRVR